MAASCYVCGRWDGSHSGGCPNTGTDYRMIGAAYVTDYARETGTAPEDIYALIEGDPDAPQPIATRERSRDFVSGTRGDCAYRREYLELIRRHILETADDRTVSA